MKISSSKKIFIPQQMEEKNKILLHSKPSRPEKRLGHVLNLKTGHNVHNIYENDEGLTKYRKLRKTTPGLFLTDFGNSKNYLFTFFPPILSFLQLSQFFVCDVQFSDFQREFSVLPRRVRVSGGAAREVPRAVHLFARSRFPRRFFGESDNSCDELVRAN